MEGSGNSILALGSIGVFYHHDPWMEDVPGMIKGKSCGFSGKSGFPLFQRLFYMGNPPHDMTGC